MGNRAAALAIAGVLILPLTGVGRALSRARACVTLGVGSIRFGPDGSTASFEAARYLRARPPNLPGAEVSVYLVDYATDAAYEVSGIVDGWVSCRPRCAPAWPNPIPTAPAPCRALDAQVGAEFVLKRWGRRLATFQLRAPPLHREAGRRSRCALSHREVLAPLFAALRDRLEKTMARDRAVVVP